MTWDAAFDIADFVATTGGVFLDDDTSYSQKTPRQPPITLPKTKVLESVAEAWGGKVLNAAEHPEFVNAVNKLAEDIKLPYKPVVAVTKVTPYGLAIYDYCPNLLASPESGGIFINQSLMKLSNSMVKQAPSDGLASFIAHELSHLKHDALNIKAPQYLPFILPAAMVAALGMYDFAHKKTQAEKGNAETMLGNIHHAADLETQKLDREQHSSAPLKRNYNFHSQVINVGRYMAAGLVGYAAALLCVRNISLAREFKADKIAVELVKNPEAFKEILTEAHVALDKQAEYVTQYYKQHAHELPIPGVKEYIAYAKAYITQHTTHAHPTLGQRLSYIDKVTAEQAARVGMVPGVA